MKMLKVWVTGKPNGAGYLASVAMDFTDDQGHMWQIRGMRLIHTEANGINLVMPNIKDAQGKWRTIFSPQNAVTSQMMKEVALAEWNRLNPNYEMRDLFEPL